MSKLFSKIFIIAGIALLLTACGFFAYNRIYDYRAGLRAQEVLDQMMAGLEWDLPPLDEMTHSAAAGSAGQGTAENPSGGRTGLGSVERPVVNVTARHEVSPDGGDSSGYSGDWEPPTYSIIGIISIPKLNVRLPVLGECTNELLRISCCRISGLVTDRPIRLVVAGHNIWSHFKGLDTLSLGDEMAFTTTDGATYYYSATEIAGIHKSDGDKILSVDGWDITLLTCKTDNTYRTMVRFAEISD